MVCKHCHSPYVVVTYSKEKKPKARHGVLYWVLVGWWLHPILWVGFTVPMIIWRLIRPNQKTREVGYASAVCQSCGKVWRVR